MKTIEHEHRSDQIHRRATFQLETVILTIKQIDANLLEADALLRQLQPFEPGRITLLMRLRASNAEAELKGLEPTIVQWWRGANNRWFARNLSTDVLMLKIKRAGAFKFHTRRTRQVLSQVKVLMERRGQLLEIFRALQIKATASLPHAARELDVSAEVFTLLRNELEQVRSQWPVGQNPQSRSQEGEGSGDSDFLEPMVWTDDVEESLPDDSQG